MLSYIGDVRIGDLNTRFDKVAGIVKKISCKYNKDQKNSQISYYMKLCFNMVNYVNYVCECGHF